MALLFVSGKVKFLTMVRLPVPAQRKDLIPEGLTGLTTGMERKTAAKESAEQNG